MSLTTLLKLSATGTHVAPLDLGNASFPFSLSQEWPLASGVGAAQADRVFTDTRTLALSATEDLDLAGSLVDAFGAVITFVTIKGVIVRAAVGNTNAVNVTRPAANGVTLFTAVSAGIALKPGYVFAWFGSGAGITITPGTADLLTFTNGGAGTSVNYDVIIIGTSA